jgi:hypothetical protein
MSNNSGRNDPCECGSGQKYKDCCGAPKLEVASVRVKDLSDFQLTPGIAEALTASLDASYREYFAAACSGRSTKEAKKQIAAIPEGERYLTRVLDSLDSAFSDFDTKTAMLDLPHQCYHRLLLDWVTARSGMSLTGVWMNELRSILITGRG